MKFYLLLLVLVFTAYPLHANHSTHHSLAKAPLVDKITIVGLTRTKEIVVLRELVFYVNEVLTSESLIESIQHLKNLRIFSKVLPFLDLTPNNHVSVTIKVEEIWTTIPYFNFRGGGDTLYGYAGVYDINSFGRFIETGIQYDNWNGESGGVIWFRNSRFLNKRQLIGADFLSVIRPRTLYTWSGEKQGKYSLNQQRLNLLFKKEIKIWLELGLTLSFDHQKLTDSETTDFIDSSTLQLLDQKNEARIYSSTFSLRLGKLNYDNYLIDGKETSFFLKLAGKETGSDESVKRLLWKNSLFWRAPHKANIGLRFNVGIIETSSIQNYFYIGGFENIRGFFDGQFRSKTYWQLNTEYRIPSFRHKWLVLQHIFFIDAIKTSNRVNALPNFNNTIYSAGTGIRIISPAIYGFNGRMDIALMSSQKTQSYISFGAQQFF